MEHVFAVLADAMLLLHLGYVLFAVGGEILILAGGLLGWRWIRNLAFRVLHLLAVVVVAIEALAGVLCPLTEWEYALRRLAGQGVEEQIPFMARLVRRLIFHDFPQWVFTSGYVTFALLAVGTIILFPPRRGRQG